MKWKKSESDFRYIEDDVRLYPYYKKKLLQAVNDIIMATPERDDNGGGKPNTIGRPVEKAVINILDDMRIMRMQTVVDAVEIAFSELDDEKRRLFQNFYWGNGAKSVPIVCDDFGISVSTFNRWQKGFLLRVGRITGAKR